MLVQLTMLMLFLNVQSNYIPYQSEIDNDANELLLRHLLRPKIVNGEPAKLGEIPYQVSFKTPVFGMSSYLNFCGGSIIKRTVVLSAAHCFVPQKETVLNFCFGRVDLKHYKTTYAVAGNLQNRVKYTENRSPGQWRRLHLIITPDTYSNSYFKDIAIVHLTSGFHFNKFVAPIPYAKLQKNYTNLQCQASGYGKTATRYYSLNLQKANLDIMDQSLCKIALGSDPKHHVCTLAQLTAVHKGDSGGPLICKNTGDPAEGNDGLLVGICSAGSEGRYSIFTRVSSYSKYIEEHGGANLNRPLIVRLLLSLWLIILC